MNGFVPDITVHWPVVHGLSASDSASLLVYIIILAYCCPRLPLPETAPPNLPNCLPSPDRGFAAGAAGVGASFSGTGGPAPGRAPSFGIFKSSPSESRRSATARAGPSSSSPPNRWARRARSWTERNFSSSSPQRMMPSSLPLSLFGLSKVVAFGVAELLRHAL